jgi:hypothetical protein
MVVPIKQSRSTSTKTKGELSKSPGGVFDLLRLGQIPQWRCLLRKVSYDLCPSYYFSLAEAATGLRGPHAVKATHRSSTDELVITDTALRLYKRMRKLEMHCDCPDGTDPDTMCKNCARSWRLNGKLCECFGLPAWQFAYEDPRSPSRRPDLAAFDRFRQLEAAASKTKDQRFKFKWEK